MPLKNPDVQGAHASAPIVEEKVPLAHTAQPPGVPESMCVPALQEDEEDEQDG